MDIFKLFFNHDQRLDKTVERNANKTEDKPEASLEDFMSPTPTFSKFYLTGTRLEDNKFGLNCLEKYPLFIEKLATIFDEYRVHTPTNTYSLFEEALEQTEIGAPMYLSVNEQTGVDLNMLIVDEESNIGHFKEELRTPLLDRHIVAYKEKARNGYDLHLFSKENIYNQLFYPLRYLVDNSFRFFSINSKRIRSERHFYFETWTLDRPPHGAEEVFEETEL